MRHHLAASLAVAVLCFSCTSITVQRVPASVALKHVCIQENPKVQVHGFLEAVRDGFTKHGITTQVFSSTAPAECEFTLTYTALRSWDLAAFLSHAELHLERSGEPIASATYHLRGKGGYALTKYRSTTTKLRPILDQLLAEYSSSTTAR